MRVTWARLAGNTRAHAFADVDLSGRSAHVEPLGPCGPFDVMRLVKVAPQYPNRCRSCEQAASEFLESRVGAVDPDSAAPTRFQP
jgi:hypothetical protein